jgi:hypothetical protein
MYLQVQFVSSSQSPVKIKIQRTQDSQLLDVVPRQNHIDRPIVEGWEIDETGEDLRANDNVDSWTSLTFLHSSPNFRGKDFLMTFLYIFVAPFSDLFVNLKVSERSWKSGQTRFLFIELLED